MTKTNQYLAVGGSTIALATLLTWWLMTPSSSSSLSSTPTKGGSPTSMSKLDSAQAFHDLTSKAAVTSLVSSLDSSDRTRDRLTELLLKHARQMPPEAQVAFANALLELYWNQDYSSQERYALGIAGIKILQLNLVMGSEPLKVAKDAARSPDFSPFEQAAMGVREGQLYLFNRRDLISRPAAKAAFERAAMLLRGDSSQNARLLSGTTAAWLSHFAVTEGNTAEHARLMREAARGSLDHKEISQRVFSAGPMVDRDLTPSQAVDYWSDAVLEHSHALERTGVLTMASVHQRLALGRLTNQPVSTARALADIANAQVQTDPEGGMYAWWGVFCRLTSPLPAAESDALRTEFRNWLITNAATSGVPVLPSEHMHPRLMYGTTARRTLIEFFHNDSTITQLLGPWSAPSLQR